MWNVLTYSNSTTCSCCCFPPTWSCNWSSCAACAHLCGQLKTQLQIIITSPPPLLMVLTRPLQMHFACSFSHHFPLHLHRFALLPHELTHAEHCSSNVVIKKNGAHTNPTHSRRKHTSLSLQQYALFLDLPCKWKSMVIPCMYVYGARCLFCGSVCIISQIIEIVMNNTSPPLSPSSLAMHPSEWESRSSSTQ